MKRKGFLIPCLVLSMCLVVSGCDKIKKLMGKDEKAPVTKVMKFAETTDVERTPLSPSKAKALLQKRVDEINHHSPMELDDVLCVHSADIEGNTLKFTVSFNENEFGFGDFYDAIAKKDVYQISTEALSEQANNKGNEDDIKTILVASGYLVTVRFVGDQSDESFEITVNPKDY